MSNRCLFSNLDQIFIQPPNLSGFSPKVYYKVEIKGFEYLLMFLTLKKKDKRYNDFDYPLIEFFQDAYLFSHSSSGIFDFRNIIYNYEDESISDIALCLIPLEPFISKFASKRIEKYGLDCLIVEDNPLRNLKKDLYYWQIPMSVHDSHTEKDNFFKAGEDLMNTLFSISEDTFFIPIFKKSDNYFELLGEVVTEARFQSFEILKTFITSIHDQEAFEDYASEEYGVIQGLIEKELLPLDFPTNYSDLILYMTSGLLDDEVIEKLGPISESVPKASIEYDFWNEQGKRESTYDSYVMDHMAKCISEYIYDVIEYLNK